MCVCVCVSVCLCVCTCPPHLKSSRRCSTDSTSQMLSAVVSPPLICFRKAYTSRSASRTSTRIISLVNHITCHDITPSTHIIMQCIHSYQLRYPQLGRGENSKFGWVLLGIIIMSYFRQAHYKVQVYSPLKQGRLHASNKVSLYCMHITVLCTCFLGVSNNRWYFSIISFSMVWMATAIPSWQTRVSKW